MDGEIWGEASVTYPDWRGTAQLDERMTVPWEGLARTVGLDGQQWQVVGFSIGGGEHGYNLRIYAAPVTCGRNSSPITEPNLKSPNFSSTRLIRLRYCSR